jgi:pimeloyl-ACP methyl ester carboxylesterase
MFYRLLLGAFLLAAAQTTDSAPPIPAPGKMIDLGGWRVHLNCTGQAKAGQSTVILEAGAGGFSVDWSLLQPRVATFARVCSYDRAGLGWSEQGPHPRTLHQVVWELHTLLEKANLPPPYVLVGHSAGGVLGRLYTYTYPSDVRGMVLVDSGFETGVMVLNDGKLVRLADTATGRPVPAVKTSGPLRDDQIPPSVRAQIEASALQMVPHATEPPYDKLPADAQRMRAWAFGQVKHWATNDNPFEGEELASLAAELRKPYRLADLPLIVVSRGLDPDDEHSRNQTTLVGLSHRGEQVIAKRSVHEVMITEPDVVAQAIQDVLAASRK